MTPQDIREKTFEKAMFGGYDMAAVQNYQEEVATELANAQKEIAVLKGKMKVLVDKIEEYRSKLGINQTDLGKMAGVSRQTISLIERGDYSPSVTLALKLAKICEVKVEDIFQYEEDEP